MNTLNVRWLIMTLLFFFLFSMAISSLLYVSSKDVASSRGRSPQSQQKVMQAHPFVAFGMAVLFLTGCGGGASLPGMIGDFADAGASASVNEEAEAEIIDVPVIVLPASSSYRGAASN